MTHESLGRKLRVLRAARGITLREAEKVTGVTRETLGALEHGQRGAYTSTLEKIAEGYGVSVSELLAEDPEVSLAGKTEAPEAGRGRAIVEESGAPGSLVEHTPRSGLSPWAMYARHVAGRIRERVLDPNDPAFRDPWAAYLFVEEKNREAAELVEFVDEELGRSPLGDIPIGPATYDLLAGFDELGSALEEAEKRADYMGAGRAETDIERARRRALEARRDREDARERAVVAGSG